MTTSNVVAQLNVTFSTEFLEILKKEIEKKLETCVDFFDDEDKEFDPMSWSGGNFHDCFEQGRSQGETDALCTVVSMIDGLIEVINENKGQ